MNIEIFGIKSHITSFDSRGSLGGVGNKVNFDICFPLTYDDKKEESGYRNAYLGLFRRFAMGEYGKMRLNIPKKSEPREGPAPMGGPPPSHSIVVYGYIDNLQVYLNPGERIDLSLKFKGSILAKKKPLPYNNCQRVAQWPDFAKDFEFLAPAEVADFLARTFMAGKKHDRQASKGK